VEPIAVDHDVEARDVLCREIGDRRVESRVERDVDARDLPLERDRTARPDPVLVQGRHQHAGDRRRADRSTLREDPLGRLLSEREVRDERPSFLIDRHLDVAARVVQRIGDQGDEAGAGSELDFRMLR
jgi:hypothetical protein